MRLVSMTALSIGAVALSACASLQPKLNQDLAMEKSACAEVGLVPGTDAFSDCFLSMNASKTYEESAASR